MNTNGHESKRLRTALSGFSQAHCLVNGIDDRNHLKTPVSIRVYWCPFVVELNGSGFSRVKLREENENRVNGFRPAGGCEAVGTAYPVPAQNTGLKPGANESCTPVKSSARKAIRRACTAVLLSCVPLLAADPSAPRKGAVTADSARPKHFPHRIWAACDFEGQTPDYGWFGRAETNEVPRYPGNATALAATPGPYRDFSAVMTGVNPVPGPRMGKVNELFVRYHLTGGSEATFQHFSLTREDNWHIRVTGLETGRWANLTLDFTRDALRNDGSPEPFVEGERMDDFKLFAGKAADASRYRLLIDDVIFFANDPTLPPEPEPFPNRIIFLAAFDTGPKEKYWPGDFELVEKPPAGAFWRAARAVPRRDGKDKFIRLQIAPLRPVGAHTKLRFRYHLTGATNMTAQIFDATEKDNRHVNLRQLKQGEWTMLYVDFSRDSRRNDGTANSPFAAGNKVDDLFFFVRPDGSREVELFVGEVVLFDAAAAGSL